MPLKGQCHEIFECFSLRQIAPPGPIIEVPYTAEGRGYLEGFLEKIEMLLSSKLSWVKQVHKTVA